MRVEHRIPIAPTLRALTGADIPDVDEWTKLRCPFHEDRRPSARISRFAFKCFSCERKGDAIKLIRQEENCGYKAALERATGLAGGESEPVPRRGGWGGGLPRGAWHQPTVD